MPFVKRVGGVIVGCFSIPQPRIQSEFLPEDSPEIVAFRNRGSLTQGDELERRITGDLALLAIVKKFAKDGGKTDKEVIDEMKSEVST